MQIRDLLLLGAPRLEQDGITLRLERRKALALLAYIAASGEPHTREHLAGLLWPEDDQARAAAYLRNALWTINRALGDDWVYIEGETVAFNPGGSLRVDVHEFRALAAQHGVDALTQAVGLYRGDFMTGFTLPDVQMFSEWQTFMAEDLRRRLCRALDTLIENYRASGSADAAIATAQRRVSVDTLDENAHRMLMQLYADAGQYALALRQYRDLTHLLNAELGTVPEAATAALMRRIEERRAAPATVTASAPVTAAPAASRASSTGLPALPSTIPIPPTPMIGRVAELAELMRLLDTFGCRLISLVGPGGMGKTRLAIQVGLESAASQNLFPDGAYFISLAPLCDADYIISSIAAALPFVGDATENAEQRLLDALRQKNLLLILDNFEHLLDGAPLLTHILENAPQVNILVTSRERLNLREEWLFEMRGLAYPVDNESPGADLPETYEAVRLFVSTAMRVRADFALTAETVRDVAAICRMVEGMPLGLELAASWVRLLTVREIAREIQNSLDFLTTSARNIPERHRSLRAVFESSWQRLTDQEQRVLGRLSVFRGGFTLEAAAEVAQASLVTLLMLVEKSLIYRSEDGRFDMHELLRQYAQQKQTDSGETCQRHADYFAAWLQRQHNRLQGAEEIAALNDIALEIDNLRSAWLFHQHDRHYPALLKMLPALFHFRSVRTYFEDITELFDNTAAQLTADSPDEDERILLALLWSCVALPYQRSRHQTEIDRLTSNAEAILRQHPHRAEVPTGLMLLSFPKRRVGRENTEAEALIREALALFEAAADRWGVASATLSLGSVLHMQIRYAEARQTYTQALALFEAIGNTSGIAHTLDLLSEHMFTLGNHNAARGYLERLLPLTESLGMHERMGDIIYMLDWNAFDATDQDTIVREQRVASLAVMETMLQDAVRRGDRRGAAWVTYNLAWRELYEDNYELARMHYSQSLQTFLELGDEEGIVWSHIFLALIAVTQRDFDAVAEHADHARDTMRDMIFPWGESGLAYVLGEAALAQHDIEAAARYYREAIRVAHGAESVLQTLRHLLGMAQVWYQRGDVERAAALAAFVRRNPASWDDTLKRAAQFMAHLPPPPPAETHTLDEWVQLATAE